MSDVDKWIEIAKRCKYLPEDDLRELCNIVCDLLLEEPNVQPVTTPVTVCGDIHGQVINYYKQLVFLLICFSSFSTFLSSWKYTSSCTVIIKLPFIRFAIFQRHALL